MILTLRTDKPEAEVGLYNETQRLSYKIWPAHRLLAETLHQTINDQLTAQNATWGDISAIVVYKGPGSFTGLRIGLSVANALAASYKIPITATSGEEWIELGIHSILNGNTDVIALPEYGAPVHITQQKK